MINEAKEILYHHLIMIMQTSTTFSFQFDWATQTYNVAQ